MIHKKVEYCSSLTTVGFGAAENFNRVSAVGSSGTCQGSKPVISVNKESKDEIVVSW